MIKLQFSWWPVIFLPANVRRSFWLHFCIQRNKIRWVTVFWNCAQIFPFILQATRWFVICYRRHSDFLLARISGKTTDVPLGNLDGKKVSLAQQPDQPYSTLCPSILGVNGIRWSERPSPTANQQVAQESSYICEWCCWWRIHTILCVLIGPLCPRNNNKRILN